MNAWSIKVNVICSYIAFKEYVLISVQFSIKSIKYTAFTQAENASIDSQKTPDLQITRFWIFVITLLPLDALNRQLMSLEQWEIFIKLTNKYLVSTESSKINRKNTTFLLPECLTVRLDYVNYMLRYLWMYIRML